jgi:hypothetical protein
MNESEWKAFLTAYNRELLASDEVRRRLAPEVIQSGWLGFPGAADAEIKAAEARLGTRLPPSYRSFLLASNGWRRPTYFIYELWPSTQIAWFRDRNQEWIDAYVGPAAELPAIADAEYFTYGEGQDSCKFRTEYLQSALEISDIGDSAILLLNPRIVTPEGEWEAWFFANWLPGATRYRSFQELMEHERRSFQILTHR